MESELRTNGTLGPILGLNLIQSDTWLSLSLFVKLARVVTSRSKGKSKAQERNECETTIKLR